MNTQSPPRDLRSAVQLLYRHQQHTFTISAIDHEPRQTLRCYPTIDLFRQWRLRMPYQLSLMFDEPLTICRLASWPKRPIHGHLSWVCILLRSSIRMYADTHTRDIETFCVIKWRILLKISMDTAGNSSHEYPIFVSSRGVYFHILENPDCLNLNIFREGACFQPIYSSPKILFSTVRGYQPSSSY